MDRNPLLSQVPTQTQVSDVSVSLASQVTAFRSKPAGLDVPLRPVTVKQVLHATSSRTLDNTEVVSIDGTQVKQVTLVAHITQIKIFENADYVTFTLEDGTGRCKGRHYSSDVQYFEYLCDLIKLMENEAIYASVLAEMVVTTEERSKGWTMLRILKMSPIKHDGHQVFYHILKCLQVHKWIEAQKGARGVMSGQAKEIGTEIQQTGMTLPRSNSTSVVASRSPDRDIQQARESSVTPRGQHGLGTNEPVRTGQSPPPTQYPPVRSSLDDSTEDTSAEDPLYPPNRNEHHPSSSSPSYAQASQATDLGSDPRFAPSHQALVYTDQEVQTSPLYPNRSLIRNELLRSAILASSAAATAVDDPDSQRAIPDSTVQASLSLNDGTAVTTTLVQSPSSIRATVTRSQQPLPDRHGWGSYQNVVQARYAADPVGLQLTGMDAVDYTAGDGSTENGTQTTSVNDAEEDSQLWDRTQDIAFEQGEDDEEFSLTFSPVRSNRDVHVSARISIEDDEVTRSPVANINASRSHSGLQHSPLIHRRISRPGTLLGMLDLENNTLDTFRDPISFRNHTPSQSVCDDRSETLDTTLAQVDAPYRSSLPTHRFEMAIQSEDDLNAQVQGRDHGIGKYLEDQSLDRKNRTLYTRLQDKRLRGDDRRDDRAPYTTGSRGSAFINVQSQAQSLSRSSTDSLTQLIRLAHSTGGLSSPTSRSYAKPEQAPPSSHRAQLYAHRSNERLPRESQAEVSFTIEGNRTKRLDPYEKLSSLERDIIIYLQRKSQNERARNRPSISSSTKRRDSTSAKSGLSSIHSAHSASISADEDDIGSIPGDWKRERRQSARSSHTVVSSGSQNSLMQRSIRTLGRGIEVGVIAKGVYEMTCEREGQSKDIDIDVKDIDDALNRLSEEGYVWMSEDGMFVGLNQGQGVGRG